MIVAAAIKTKDGKVWALARPARHADILGVIASTTGDVVRGEEQGFLICDTCHDGELCSARAHGFFVRRPFAQRHGRDCGQIEGELCGGSVLTSEDLW